MKIETYKGIVSITDEVPGVRSKTLEDIKNMPLVRFKSHKNPFLIEAIKLKNYDIKAVNPNVKEKVLPKPDELIKIIEHSQIKINEGLRRLKEIN